MKRLNSRGSTKVLRVTAGTLAYCVAVVIAGEKSVDRINKNSQGVTLRGFDTVAYYELASSVKGSPRGDEKLWPEVLWRGAFDLIVEPFESFEVRRIVDGTLRAARVDPNRRRRIVSRRERL